MTRPARAARTNTLLSPSVHQRLNLYSLAASAAGVGVLALAQPAEGKIVYKPAHKTISPNQVVPLDLNHDGSNDFSFKNTYSFDGNSGGGSLMVVPVQQANAIWGNGASASALDAGVRLGPGGPFAAGNNKMARMFWTPSSTPNTRGYGQWNGASKRYLGLKFTIRGKTHFGWARLNVTIAPGGVTGVLTGYAYETVVKKAIVTGKTKGNDSVRQQGTGLGQLARGASSFTVHRR